MNYEARIKTAVEAPDGRVLGIDRRRTAEVPFVHLTNLPSNAVVLAANAISPPLLMAVSGEGPTEIFALAAQRTGAARVLLMIQDGQQQRALMNGACHIDTIFGSGAQPYRLPEALYIDERRALQVFITDISAAPNTVRLAAFGKRYLSQQFDPKMKRIRSRLDAQQYISCPFFYTLDQGPVTLAASASTQSTINISHDFLFELHQISAVSAQRFSMDITDEARGESIIDGLGGTHFEVSSGLIVGSNNFSMRFFEPRLFESSAKLLVNLTNLSGALATTIHLTLGGIIYAKRMWR